MEIPKGAAEVRGVLELGAFGDCPNELTFAQQSRRFADAEFCQPHFCGRLETTLYIHAEAFSRDAQVVCQHSNLESRHSGERFPLSVPNSVESTSHVGGHSELCCPECKYGETLPRAFRRAEHDHIVGSQFERVQYELGLTQE